MPLQTKNIRNWIKNNTYSVRPSTKFIARCIDGRYKNKKHLPALAIPGGDAGQLAILFATANKNGIKLDIGKAWNAICEIVGGKQNIRFHTDTHARKNKIAGGCGHVKLKSLNPKQYSLTTNQMTLIKKRCKDIFTKYKKSQVELEGDHREGAVLMVRGNYAVYPQHNDAQLFIVHLSLIDNRHKELAKLLIKTKAVQLQPNQSLQFLHEALNAMHEKHLMTTAKVLAKGLPIYSAIFKTKTSFKVEKIGKVT